MRAELQVWLLKRQVRGGCPEVEALGALRCAVAAVLQVQQKGHCWGTAVVGALTDCGVAALERGRRKQRRAAGPAWGGGAAR